MNIDANINSASCMVQKSHIGYDTYINVCSGATYDVSWTGVEWFVVGVIVFMALALLSVLGLLFFSDM